MVMNPRLASGNATRSNNVVMICSFHFFEDENKLIAAPAKAAVALTRFRKGHTKAM